MTHASARLSVGVLCTIALLGAGCNRKDTTPITNPKTETSSTGTNELMPQSSATTTASQPTTQTAPAPTIAANPVIKPAVKPTTKPTAPPAQKTFTITIVDGRFSPQVMAIAKGDTVIWVNKDTKPHTTTSDGALLWDSGALLEGNTYKRIFAQTGTYTYHCGAHPDMTGTVIVR